MYAYGLSQSLKHLLPTWRLTWTKYGNSRVRKWGDVEGPPSGWLLGASLELRHLQPSLEGIYKCQVHSNWWDDMSLKAKNSSESLPSSRPLRAIQHWMTRAAPVTFHLIKGAWEPQMKPTGRSVEQFYRLLHYIHKNKNPKTTELHCDPEQ